MNFLPYDIQKEFLKYLDSDKIVEYCRTGILSSHIEKDFYIWRDLAVKDFKFPNEAFPFLRPKSPLDKYLLIKNCIPSEEALSNLNLLADIYDFDTDELAIEKRPPIIFYDFYKLEEETFPSFLERFETLKSNYKTLAISGSDYFKLTKTSRWHRDVLVNGTLKLFQQDNIVIDTIIRGNKNQPVTYYEILRNAKNLIPFKVEGFVVTYGEFLGFTNYGIPILTFEIDWAIV